MTLCIQAGKLLTQSEVNGCFYFLIISKIRELAWYLQKLRVRQLFSDIPLPIHCSAWRWQIIFYKLKTSVKTV